MEGLNHLNVRLVSLLGQYSVAHLKHDEIVQPLCGGVSRFIQSLEDAPLSCSKLREGREFRIASLFELSFVRKPRSRAR